MLAETIDAKTGVEEPLYRASFRPTEIRFPPLAERDA